MKLYKTDIYLINDNVHTKFDLIMSIGPQYKILTSIKGYNSVANVQKIVLYNPKLDVINVNVYTNFG